MNHPRIFYDLLLATPALTVPCVVYLVLYPASQSRGVYAQCRYTQYCLCLYTQYLLGTQFLYTRF